MKIVRYFLLILLTFFLCSCSQNKTEQITITGDADRILVEKAKRRMYLLHENKIIKTYKISLGSDPVGAKVREGDNKTPEGDYRIVSHNPRSSYHLSLKISYPDSEQKKAAEKGNYSAGGDIMIHGFPNKIPDFIFSRWHESHDWTQGCIAVTNEEIEEIYRLVRDGTPITIRP